MPDVAISVRDLGKRYYARPAPRGATLWRSLRHAFRFVGPIGKDANAFWALRSVSFELAAGERLGIIGRNGAGKSTLLKILARVAYPTTGEARLRGRVTSLLEIGTGFNPNLSGRENVYLNAFLHGLTRPEVDHRFDDIVDFSGMLDFLELPVRHYSSGMFMRLAFAVAAHLDPDILLLDEVLAVGDLSFQQRCLKRMEALGSEGRTILFVSHSMDAIVRFCTRCIWLDEGQVVADGPADEVTQAYLERALGARPREYWIGDASWAFSREPGPAGSGAADAAVAWTAKGREVAPGTAPGNDLVRLVAARVINASHETVSTVRTDEAVGIQIISDVLKSGKNIQPAIHVRTSQDALAFVVAYTDREYMHVGLPEGRTATTAWIPPHLLNAGVFSITIEMATPDPLERHCRIERALTFHVTDPIDVDAMSARGLYGREFPGAVRPRLRWETEAIAVPTRDDGRRPERPVGPEAR